MIEHFGQDSFEHLKLNEPYHSVSNEDVNMPEVGTFHNREVVLEWIGRSQRNGQDCALIRYEAFLNPLDIDNGGMTLKARSNYWDRFGCRYRPSRLNTHTQRDGRGRVELAGQDTTQVINVIRSGTFEPVSAK